MHQRVSATVPFRSLCCIFGLEHFVCGSVYAFCVKQVMAGCSLLNDSKLEQSCQLSKVPQQLFDNDFTFVGDRCLYSSLLSGL